VGAPRRLAAVHSHPALGLVPAPAGLVRVSPVAGVVARAWLRVPVRERVRAVPPAAADLAVLAAVRVAASAVVPVGVRVAAPVVLAAVLVAPVALDVPVAARAAAGPGSVVAVLAAPAVAVAVLAAAVVAASPASAVRVPSDAGVVPGGAKSSSR
jgi:ribonuclease E